MAAYLVLYRGRTSASERMANTTREMAKAGMEAWMTWAATAGSRCSKSSRCPAAKRISAATPPKVLAPGRGCVGLVGGRGSRG